MVAGGGEHNVKSVNELFIDRKDQSSLNRFITDPKWDIKAVANQAKNMLLGEVNLNNSFEYKIIDDPYAANTAKTPRWSVITIPQLWEQC